MSEPVLGGPIPRRERHAARATIGLACGLVIGAVALSFMPGGWASTTGASTVSSAYATDIHLVWWQLALMFGVAAVCVAHIEINDQTHTVSLSELPLILGLLFASPEDLVAGRMVGEALVLGLYVRQPPGKLAFNLSVFFAETTLATVVYALIAPAGGGLDAMACAAAFIAAAAAGQLSAAAVWVVIRIHDGREPLARLMIVSAITTTANASLAVLAAVLAVTAPWALVPLLVVCAVVVAAYRSYARLTRRYGGLQVLYEFTTNTSGTSRHDQTTTTVLEEARRLMRARVAMALVRDKDPGGPPGQGFGSNAGWHLTTSSGSPEAHEPHPADAGRPTAALPAWAREHVLAGSTLLIRNGTHEPRGRKLLADLGVSDLVAAPMVSGDRVLGVLVAADRLGNVSRFDTEDALLLATLACQAAVALQNAGLVEQLHEQIRARESDALHDSLTGLPNRAAFLRSLDAALSGPGSRRTAVLLMDLNGFKEVNDTLGHRTGDRLLIEVADRLRRLAPAGATVARLGGDEFAIVLPQSDSDHSSPERLLATAHELSHLLREPFTLDELTLEVGGSIGVAVAPDHSADAATLLQRADVAMYAAKNAHLPASLYNPAADWHSQDRLRLAHELRRAIETKGLGVAYQPIARAGDGLVTDVEALARWHHPELGSIGPDTFVPVAERTGLIHELTWNILDQVLAQASVWRASGLDVVVNVNLSVQLLRDRDISQKIAHLLLRHGVPPAALTLEMTESEIMTDPGGMIRTLEDLVSTGLSLAIDDFGTGHSSLAYLQRLPMSKVKIDKSLVTPMAVDPNARAIVRSVIDLAHNLELYTVAEGVEDDRTLDLLTGLGCDFIQGYRLSRPIPANEVTAWLTGRTGSVRTA